MREPGSDPPVVGQVTPHLFIGGTRAWFAVEELRRRGITHILKLYFDDPYWPEPFVVFEHPLDDGVFIPWETLEEGLAFIRAVEAREEKVLVVCGLGISRSATFVLAHLLEKGGDLREAFLQLRAVRPQAWPARALWQTLITHYQAPYTLSDIDAWNQRSNWAGAPEF